MAKVFVTPPGAEIPAGTNIVKSKVIGDRFKRTNVEVDYKAEVLRLRYESHNGNEFTGVGFSAEIGTSGTVITRPFGGNTDSFPSPSWLDISARFDFPALEALLMGKVTISP